MTYCVLFFLITSVLIPVRIRRMCSQASLSSKTALASKSLNKVMPKMCFCSSSCVSRRLLSDSFLVIVSSFNYNICSGKIQHKLPNKKAVHIASESSDTIGTAKLLPT